MLGLERLSLIDCGLCDEDVVKVARCCAAHPALGHIDLQDNALCTCAAVVEALSAWQGSGVWYAEVSYAKQIEPQEVDAMHEAVTAFNVAREGRSRVILHCDHRRRLALGACQCYPWSCTCI